MSFVDTLTSKFGPLPVWAYGGMLGGVAGIYFWRQNRKKESEPTDESSAGGNGSFEMSPADEGLVDSAGWGASVYTSGPANMPAALQDDGIATIPINPQTGNPYAIDVANPLNPATGQPYAIDVALGEQRNTYLERELERVQQEKEQVMNSAPSPVSSPEVVAPTPPPPIVTTPAPVSRPSNPVSPKGTVIWTGGSKPDQAVINKFIAEKYGRPVSWRTVDNGAGKTPRFKVVTQ